MQTLDQKYATIAYDHVSAIKKDEPEYKKYGAIAHKLPILIHTAGLGQALEFVNSRGKPVQKKLLEHLALIVELSSGAELLATVREAPLSGYIRLTRQVLAALVWYKRFAQSILDVDVTESLGTEEESEKV